MNRLIQIEVNPQQGGRNRLSPAVTGLLPKTLQIEANPQPIPQGMFLGFSEFSTPTCERLYIECNLQNRNSVREPGFLTRHQSGGDVLGRLFRRSNGLFFEKTEWTGEMQVDLDALIQKEAFGTISELETIQLERLQVARDQAALGPDLIRRMNEEQQALTELVDAFERYVRATRSR